MCSSMLPYNYCLSIDDKARIRLVNLDFCWTNTISGDNICKDSF